MLKSALLVLALGVSALAADVIGGPYVVNATSRSATIAWVERDSEVKVGKEPGSLTTSIPVLKSQKISLTGLQPGTLVHYEIPGKGGKGQFKTAPTGEATFSFGVFGDTRTRHDMHRKVVTAFEKTNPDFVLHTGDLVADGLDTAQWPIFFDIERELLRKTVFFPVLGNHERNSKHFHEFFDVKSHYYSFNWGTAHFIVLNTDIANAVSGAEARRQFWADQVRWLEEDLQRAQGADFRFIISHHPPYTAYQKVSHMSKEALGLVPLLEKYKVTAIFSGHDHTYQHHEQNGVHYVVTGGGGAPLNHVDQPLPFTKKALSTEHFVTVDVTGNTATLRATGLDGKILDEFQLK
jgi:3',5'-cyclic AMP phosphodiesterase CpdA